MPGHVKINNLGSEMRTTVTGQGGEDIPEHIQTVSSSPVNFLSQDLASETTHVLWSVFGADINVRFDGGDPGAASGTGGHLIEDKVSSTWSRHLAEKAKAIRTASTDVTVRITELQAK